MYYIFKITNIQIIVCVGNYYDLNSHKISILAFVQQMVSGGRGDTMLGSECAECGVLTRQRDRGCGGRW